MCLIIEFTAGRHKLKTFLFRDFAEFVFFYLCKEFTVSFVLKNQILMFNLIWDFTDLNVSLVRDLGSFLMLFMPIKAMSN